MKREHKEGNECRFFSLQKPQFLQTEQQVEISE